ncbi:MAG: GtrA family protein [Myxococcota bacterium]
MGGVDLGAVWRLARSGLAGAGASLADLALLTALVQFGGVAPRAASVPALLLGAVVMFFGQKYVAFRSHAKPSVREVVLFVLVQLGGFILTALLFDAALRLEPRLAPYYVAVRLVTTNLVWLLYSFPLWHLVFRASRSVDAPH